MAGKQHTIEEYAEALKKSKGLYTMAARALGVTWEAVDKRVRSSPTLQEIVKAERESMIDTAELHLFKLVQDGDFEAIKLIVRTLGKGRGYTERVEQTGPDGEAITVKVIYENSD